MPGDEAWIVRLLDEKAGVPAQDVRPDHILYRVEDSGMPDHVVDPAEENVAAVAHLSLDRTAGSSLIIFKLAAKLRDLGLAENIDREVVATLAVVGDLSLGQNLGHWFPPIFFAMRSALSGQP